MPGAGAEGPGRRVCTCCAMQSRVVQCSIASHGCLNAPQSMVLACIFAWQQHASCTPHLCAGSEIRGLSTAAKSAWTHNTTQSSCLNNSLCRLENLICLLQHTQSLAQTQIRTCVHDTGPITAEKSNIYFFGATEAADTGLQTPACCQHVQRSRSCTASRKSYIRLLIE